MPRSRREASKPIDDQDWCTIGDGLAFRIEGDGDKDLTWNHVKTSLQVMGEFYKTWKLGEQTVPGLEVLIQDGVFVEGHATLSSTSEVECVPEQAGLKGSTTVS